MGTCSRGGGIHRLIYSFHMPLFFIISGILFAAKPRTYASFADFRQESWRIIVKYGIPFFIFTTIGSIVKYVIYGEVNFKLGIYEMYNKIGSVELLSVHLWFLVLLAIAKIIMPYLLRASRESSTRKITLFLLLVLLANSISLHSYSIPMRLGSVFSVLTFVYLGYLMKDKVLLLLENRRFKLYSLLFFPVFIFLSFFNGPVAVNVPVHNDMLIYLVCAIYGTLLTFYVSSFNNRLFEYIGKNSLLIYCVHMIWIAILIWLINMMFGTAYKEQINLPLSLCILGGIFVLLVSILTSWLISPIYKRLSQIINKLLTSPIKSYNL